MPVAFLFDHMYGLQSLNWLLNRELSEHYNVIFLYFLNIQDTPSANQYMVFKVPGIAKGVLYPN